MKALSVARSVAALVTASLVPVAAEAFFFLVVSSRTRDAAGYVESGHFEKWIEILGYSIMPATLIVVCAWWIVLFALTGLFRAFTSRGLVIGAAILGVLGGSAVVVFLLNEGDLKLMLLRFTVLVPLAVLIAVVTTGTFCVLAGLAWGGPGRRC